MDLRRSAIDVFQPLLDVVPFALGLVDAPASKGFELSHPSAELDFDRVSREQHRYGFI